MWPPPPPLSTQCSLTRTLSCISHYYRHITKYFTFITNKLPNFYMFITLRPLLMLYVYKSYLTPPSPTNSVYLSTLWLYFSPLATKTPCLRKFQHIHTKHNNTHPPTFHARSSFKPFRLILFITFYLLRNLLLTIPLLSPPLNFRFFSIS